MVLLGYSSVGTYSHSTTGKRGDRFIITSLSSFKSVC